MNSRHLILIVALGSGLIILAPTSEKAGQADKAEPVNAIPVHEDHVDQAELQPASFNGDAENLKSH